MTKREESLASMIGLLRLIPSGKATVSVGQRPLLSVDADSKTLDLEADGIGEAGLRISDLIGPGREASLIGGSLHITGALSHAGWKLNLFAEGEKVLSMGSGVSRLTGHLSVNPLRLKKLMKLLR